MKKDCENALPNYYCLLKRICLFHNECDDCKEYEKRSEKNG